MPQISVIIPTYNVEKSIDICLGSLIIQSFSDFEVLCLDDCSTDNTLSILGRYAKFDNRIKIVSNNKKRGPDVLRSVGIEKAQSPYCVFVDADDFCSPLMLQKYFESIENNGSDYVYGTSLSYNKKTQRITEHCMIPKEIFIHYVKGNVFNAENTPDFLPFKMNSEFWGKMFRTELIKGANFAVGSGFHDIMFCFECFFKAKKISYVFEPLYVYNYHREGSLSMEFNGLEIFSSIDAMRQTLEKFGKFEKYKNAYIDFKLSRIWYYLLSVYPQYQENFFEHTKATFSEENFGNYDFNILRKNKFYFPTLGLLGIDFAKFKYLYLKKGGEDGKE